MTTSTTTSSVHSSTSTSRRKGDCEGSKEKCEKPADSFNTTAVVVAVVIPVVVVGLVLAFVLYKVYRKNKKEELDDNDPDFDGDAEYLPDFGQQFEMDRNIDPAGYRAPSTATRAFSNQPNPFNDDNGSFGNSQTPANPFQLPSATDDSTSLRNFAKTFQNSDFDGYKFATHSASQLSISRPSSAAGNAIGMGVVAAGTSGHTTHQFNKQPANLSKLSNPSNGFSSVNDDNILRYSEIVNDVEDSDDENDNDAVNADFESSTNEPAFRQDMPTSVVALNMNDAHNDYGKQIENDGNSDIHTSTFKSSDSNASNSPNNGGEGVIMQEPFIQSSASHDNDSNVPKKKFLENEGDVYVKRNGDDSDEDIERMKSIYQVYLDRNGTMKSIKEGNPVPEGFQPADKLPHDASNIISGAIQQKIEPAVPRKEGEELEKKTEDSSHNVYQNEYSFEQEGNDPTVPVHGEVHEGYHTEQGKTSLNAPELNDTSQPRVASSIYDVQSQVDNGYSQNHYYYNNHYYGQNQYDGSIPVPYDSRVQHNAAPPTMESIEELPRPSNLPFSSSSHSLTSFKSKGSNVRIPASARVPANNQGYNPIDHPELYFHQNNGSDPGLYYDQTSANTSPSQLNSTGSKVLPHHLVRQSVVMTNPNELSQNTLFKPAGSFSRVISESRSSSLMSNVNTYQQQVQDNYIKSRVSGILDDTDVMQPPSMGSVLPHSGSQEDLRKQLGSSHNYNVV